MLLPNLSIFFVFSNISLFYLFPLRLKALGGTDPQIGFIMSLFSISMVISRPIWGRIISSFGERKIIMISIFIISFSSLIYILSTSINWHLMGLRLLHGLGSSGFIAGIFSLLSKSTSQRRAGATFSLTGIAIMTSMAISPSIGEVLIARYGFSSLFITASILSLIPVLIVPFISKQNQPNTVRSLAQRPSYLVFLKEKRFLYLLLSTWIFSHSQATVFNFISLLLKEYKRLPSTFFFPSFSISILSLFILSKTLDSVKKSRLLKISYPIYSFSIFMIPLSIKMDISLLSTAMFGYGIASLFSIHNTLAATYGVMEHRHYSMSLFTAVYDLGFITGPIIGGLILNYSRYDMLMNYMSLFSTIGLLIAFSNYLNEKETKR
ncbi:MFS transporter [Methanophagales archaeon]|nr:MAG: MFS transporter [Methanophagales archaeon]